MKKLTLILLLPVFISVELFAADVDTISVYSPKMDKKINVVVISPSVDGSGSKVSAGKMPTLYLLHGFGDDYSGWVKKAPIVKKLADLYNMLIVCPDGSRGWYWDSPIDEKSQYETFITKELIPYVDEHYNTFATREKRAVTGLSMGGQGGLYLGFRHQDLFGACGSMSGGVDIRAFPENWDMKKFLGEQREYPKNWEDNTVINQLYNLTPNSIKIIIDCGVDDFFYEVNERLHKELLYRNIPHDYISRPGAHNWSYWNNAIQYQMLFFSNYFSANK